MLYVAVKRLHEIPLNGYEYLLDAKSKIIQFVSKDAAIKFLKENGVIDFDELEFEWNFIVYKENFIANEIHIPLMKIFDDCEEEKYENSVGTIDRMLLIHISNYGSFGGLTPSSLNQLLSLYDHYKKVGSL
jgi:hypothetical protein